MRSWSRRTPGGVAVCRGRDPGAGRGHPAPHRAGHGRPLRDLRECPLLLPGAVAVGADRQAGRGAGRVAIFAGAAGLAHRRLAGRSGAGGGPSAPGRLPGQGRPGDANGAGAAHGGAVRAIPDLPAGLDGKLAARRAGGAVGRRRRRASRGPALADRFMAPHRRRAGAAPASSGVRLPGKDCRAGSRGAAGGRPAAARARVLPAGDPAAVPGLAAPARATDRDRAVRAKPVRGILVRDRRPPPPVLPRQPPARPVSRSRQPPASGLGQAEPGLHRPAAGRCRPGHGRTQRLCRAHRIDAAAARAARGAGTARAGAGQRHAGGR